MLILYKNIQSEEFLKSISIFFMAIILVPMLSWSQGNAPIDTSESIVKNPTESTLEENEEYEEVYEYEENYAPSQKLVYKDPFGPEWEKKHMIAKGFKIGLVTTRGLILKNVVNDVKLSSGMLTGFEIGYAYIPKVNQLGFFKSVASLGFKTRFYSLSGSFNEDPILFDKDFSISGIDLDLTYSVYPKTFIWPHYFFRF
jgi:hypothetical protein